MVKGNIRSYELSNTIIRLHHFVILSFSISSTAKNYLSYDETLNYNVSQLTLAQCKNFKKIRA